MASTKLSEYELWQQAFAQAENIVVQLDELRSTLKSLGCSSLQVNWWGHFLTIKDLAMLAELLCTEVRRCESEVST